MMWPELNVLLHDYLIARGAVIQQVPQSVMDLVDKEVAAGLTSEKRARLNRLFIRLMNCSPKARRWARLYDAGELSGEEMLRLADMTDVAKSTRPFSGRYF